MIGRILKPIQKLLRQGITPEKIALTIAVGLTLGVIPVLGSSTLLCAAAAGVLRLNPAAIQLVNGLSYPLQLLLIVPFLRAGAWIFGASLPALTVGSILHQIRTNIGHAIVTLGSATLHALVAWVFVGAVISLLVYAGTLPLLRRAWHRQPVTRPPEN